MVKFYDSWDHLLTFMLEGLELEIPPPSAPPLSKVTSLYLRRSHPGADQPGQGDERSQSPRGRLVGLTEDEMAFYDALGVNDSAVQVLRSKAPHPPKDLTIHWALEAMAR